MGTHIYICTQAIILLISRVFLTGVIHFCTQKSCISKCLWWISCSNFEPLSRIFNAQTSTKTWVGTCAHKQQLLCHSSVDSHRHLWIPTDTYGVPACCAHLPCPLALSLLCWGSVPAPDRCWGFRAGLQSASVTWTAKPASGSELKSWLQTAQCLGAQKYIHTGDSNRQNLRLGTNGSPAGNGTLWFY